MCFNGNDGFTEDMSSGPNKNRRFSVDAFETANRVLEQCRPSHEDSTESQQGFSISSLVQSISSVQEKSTENPKERISNGNTEGFVVSGKFGGKERTTQEANWKDAQQQVTEK